MLAICSFHLSCFEFNFLKLDTEVNFNIILAYFRCLGVLPTCM